MSYDISPASGFPNMYDSMNTQITKYGQNVTVLVILTTIIIGFYFVFKYLGSNSVPNMNPLTTNPSGMKYIEILMWGAFIFLILINGLQYFFALDIKAAVKDIFTAVPEVAIDIAKAEGVNGDNGYGNGDDNGYDNGDNGDNGYDDNGDNGDGYDENGEPIPEIMYAKQVFHIPGNEYTYDDAGALCKAYDARLATIKEVQDAYDDGGEWCSYGWSENQLALFPTQRKTYDKLMKIKGHHHDCGRVGINGGYIKNPNVRFGVNCYGHKPKASDRELKYMRDLDTIPTTHKDRKFERRVRHYRRKIQDILVAPFNKDQWSEV